MSPAHVASGWTCTVGGHILDDDPRPCEECRTCGRFIRPSKMGEECVDKRKRCTKCGAVLYQLVMAVGNEPPQVVKENCDRCNPPETSP